MSVCVRPVASLHPGRAHTGEAVPPSCGNRCPAASPGACGRRKAAGALFGNRGL